MKGGYLPNPIDESPVMKLHIKCQICNQNFLRVSQEFSGSLKINSLAHFGFTTGNLVNLCPQIYLLEISKICLKVLYAENVCS